MQLCLVNLTSFILKCRIITWQKILMAVLILSIELMSNHDSLIFYCRRDLISHWTFLFTDADCKTCCLIKLFIQQFWLVKGFSIERFWLESDLLIDLLMLFFPQLIYLQLNLSFNIINTSFTDCILKQ